MSEVAVFGRLAHRSVVSEAGEGGLAGAVFEEARHAGSGVVGAEHLDETAAFEFEAVGERSVESLVDHALADGVRRQRACGDLAGERE